MDTTSTPVNGIKVSTFTKTKRLLTPSPARGFVFETDKQRNVAYIEKGITKPGRISYDVLRRAVSAVHIARICVNVLKEKVTKTKWIIKPIDPAVDASDYEDEIKQLTDLFKHPNRNDETFRTLLDKVLEDLLVLDAVSIEKTRFPDGTLAELHFVDSATIRPVFDEFGNQDVEIPLATKEEGMVDLPVSYVQVMNNSLYGGPESGEIVAAWPKKDFLHFHMHPQGAMEGIGYGMSPIEGVLSVVANLLNADNYNGNYFEDGAFPPAIIQILGQINQRDLETYKNYLQQELSGRFHRPAVMAGGAEAKVLNLKDFSNRDMEFMEYTKFLARLLAAAYGLSGQDIGLTDEIGSKNVSETQADLSNQKGYSSVLHLIKEVFNQEVIWKDFGYEELEFDWVADDSMDPKDAADMHTKNLQAGIVTLNEARQKSGYQPFESWADKPMVLTATGYVPIIAPVQDPAQEKEEKDMKGDKSTQEEPISKDPEDKGEDKEESKVGGERKYQLQDQQPDNSRRSEAVDKIKRKSVFKTIFGGLMKSSRVIPTPGAIDLEQDVQNNPVMFGVLFENEPEALKVKALFKKQDPAKLLAKGYMLGSYTYNYNSAMKILAAFVVKNPFGSGGLVLSEDTRGVRYTLYVKKENDNV